MKVSRKSSFKRAQSGSVLKCTMAASPRSAGARHFGTTSFTLPSGHGDSFRAPQSRDRNGSGPPGAHEYSAEQIRGKTRITGRLRGRKLSAHGTFQAVGNSVEKRVLTSVSVSLAAEWKIGRGISLTTRLKTVLLARVGAVLTAPAEWQGTAQKRPGFRRFQPSAWNDGGPTGKK